MEESLPAAASRFLLPTVILSSRVRFLLLPNPAGLQSHLHPKGPQPPAGLGAAQRGGDGAVTRWGCVGSLGWGSPRSCLMPGYPPNPKSAGSRKFQALNPALSTAGHSGSASSRLPVAQGVWGDGGWAVGRGQATSQAQLLQMLPPTPPAPLTNPNCTFL